MPGFAPLHSELASSCMLSGGVRLFTRYGPEPTMRSTLPDEPMEDGARMMVVKFTR